MAEIKEKLPKSTLKLLKPEIDHVLQVNSYEFYCTTMIFLHAIALFYKQSYHWPCVVITNSQDEDKTKLN